MIKFISRDIKRRFTIINNYSINTLFDIGANTGQYSKKMRKYGYKSRIISFEPLKFAFDVLQKKASKDKNWEANNYALGNEAKKSTINIAENSYSSSILDMMPEHINSSPKSKYIGQQEIEIKTLDSVFDSFTSENDRVMIKVDTQGFEKNVIDGASKSLEKILIIQLEMSIVPLYTNEMLYLEMIKYLEEKGFELYSLENGHYNRQTGQLLQVDGFFVNKSKMIKQEVLN